MSISKQAIDNVFKQLKNREIHPSGSFDSAGRWYSDYQELMNVREPSRAYPYSQMTHARTKKYVNKVACHFNCQTEQELLNHV